jgi:hypothetical protein
MLALKYQAIPHDTEYNNTHPNALSIVAFSIVALSKTALNTAYAKC